MIDFDFLPDPSPREGIEEERRIDEENWKRKKAEALSRYEMTIGEAEQAILELIRRYDAESEGHTNGAHVISEVVVAAIAAGKIPHVRMEF